MTPKEHLEFQKMLQGESYQFPLHVPPGTEALPLPERLHIYLAVFESGCSCTLPDGRPEECSECVRAFVDAVKGAVDQEVASDPLNAMKRMLDAIDTKPPQ